MVYNMVLIEVRQEVKRIDNPVVVHEPELALKRDICGRLWSLGNQYNVGSLLWSSLTNTPNLAAI